MNAKTLRGNQTPLRLSPLMAEGAFSRVDEQDDEIFYGTDRFVSHLDSFALTTVEKLIGELIVEESPVILDLMAGWDSHIPENIRPSKVVGLGLNKNEMEKNRVLEDFVIHDLNGDPSLPFPDRRFDAVLLTVSVDYLVRPIEVFGEVGRVLKPGGLFLVIFSTRMFPQKAVKVWRESTEDERVLLVEEFFDQAEVFEKPRVFISKGKPRPREDKYAQFTNLSDPIYAVYADRKGGSSDRKQRPYVTMAYGDAPGEEELKRRKQAIKETLRCPYCGERMRKWAVPDNPFGQTWDNEFMYICFNDGCPYFVRGWDYMYREGNRGVSYRLMFNPEKNCCMPVPVPSPRALREGIID